MLTEVLVATVKENLNITNTSKDIIILDVIQEAINYCNLVELPAELEFYIRKKVQGIVNYETEFGIKSIFDITSIKEGDTLVTYKIDENTSKETVYGLSVEDKKRLQSFRRLRH